MSEMFQALNKAALYLALYERHAENLEFHSPNLYQFMARELMEAAKSKRLFPIIKQISQNFDTVREIVECQEVTSRIQNNRMYHYPELNELMERIATKE